eukprot:scaffold42330_cov28-Tisochrysis_lutea.AAC.3
MKFFLTTPPLPNPRVLASRTWASHTAGQDRAACWRAPSTSKESDFVNDGGEPVNGKAMRGINSKRVAKQLG